MSMKPPPTRYRVVEKGRRLVVIDTLTGAPVREHGDGRTPPPAQPVRQSPAGVDDGSVFVTRRWFDKKAPRTVRLNYASRQQVKNFRFVIAVAAAILVSLSFLLWPFFPILLVVLLVQPKLREPARAAVTRWIDGLDQAA
jgi:hypothetical protein